MEASRHAQGRLADWDGQESVSSRAWPVGSSIAQVRRDGGAKSADAEARARAGIDVMVRKNGALCHGEEESAQWSQPYAGGPVQLSQVFAESRTNSHGARQPITAPRKRFCEPYTTQVVSTAP